MPRIKPIKFTMAVVQTGELAPPVLGPTALREIGEAVVRNQVGRWKMGLNAAGAPAKPLKPATAKAKVSYGQPPIRNNIMTGALQRYFRVIQARDGKIKVGVTAPFAKKHAEKAQRAEVMIGLAPQEEAALVNLLYRGYGLYLQRAWRPKRG